MLLNAERGGNRPTVYQALVSTLFLSNTTYFPRVPLETIWKPTVSFLDPMNIGIYWMVLYLPRTTRLRSALCLLRYVKSVVRGMTLLSDRFLSPLHAARGANDGGSHVGGG